MRKFLVPLAAVSLAQILPVTASEVRHAGAHVHGTDFVQMVLDGTELQITYQMVAGQLTLSRHSSDDHDHDYKHDHDHSADAEQTKTRQQAIAQLEAFDALFHLPSAAACTLTGFEGVLKNVTHAGHDGHDHSGHQDAILQYAFNCGSPSQLTSIEFHSFETYGDHLETVQVEGLIGSTAVSANLKRNSPTLEW